MVKHIFNAWTEWVPDVLVKPHPEATYHGQRSCIGLIGACHNGVDVRRAKGVRDRCPCHFSQQDLAPHSEGLTDR